MDRISEIFHQEVDTLVKLEDQLDSTILEMVDLLKEARGNILITGIGTSATIARRMAHLLGCVGASAFYIHPSDQQHGASGALKEGDTIVAFSKGGESTEINSLLKIAQKRGCKLAAITGRDDSTMSNLLDKQVVIKVPEDSEPFGMLATTSSLAAGLVADIICTILLEKTGYSQDEFGETHPGGMVGIKVNEEDNI